MISDPTKWTPREQPSAARFHGKHAYVKWLLCDEVSADVRKALEKSTDSKSDIVYAVSRCPTGETKGLVAYHSIDTVFGATAVSFYAFGDPEELSSSVAEAVYLLMKHVFEVGYRRVEYVCSATDDSARDSAIRLGFSFEGMRRQNFVAKDGRNGDDYYFSIVDRDWPVYSKAYERWLSDDNAFGNEPRRALEKFIDDEGGPMPSPKFPPPNVDPVPNWTPAKVPDSKTLTGRLVRLEKLDTAKHGSDLFLALNGAEADPNLWQYVLPGPFKALEQFKEYLDGQLSTGKLPLYAVVDVKSNVAEGIIGLGYFLPEHGRITIRHVVYGSGMRRSAKGTEAVYLVLQEAFSLGNRRVEWECGNNNDPSKKAALRLGFTYESLHRQRYTYKEQSIDAVTYSILDKEWPSIKQALEEWLAPENHTSKGQKVALSEFTRRYRS